jgi:hypothetical protein
MITVSDQVVVQGRAGRLVRTALALPALALTVLALTVLISACGSGAHTTASGASKATTATQQTCQQLAAVLSDGPDPGADPVGYAEAQVLPLRQIHSPDQTLEGAISTLATAYNSFYAAEGTGSGVKSALTTAVNRINSLCPDAGATT